MSDNTTEGGKREMEMEELIIAAGGTDEDVRAWKAGEVEFDQESLEFQVADREAGIHGEY